MFDCLYVQGRETVAGVREPLNVWSDLLNLIQRNQTDPAELRLGANGRFSARVDFVDPRDSKTGHGQAHTVTADTGAFSFFNPDNLEIFAKVLDGRPVNGKFWVYIAGLSDLDYTLTVTDREKGKTKSYHNPKGSLTSKADVEAFES